MASDIQPEEATLATTGLACLVGNMAWILISSLYILNSSEGWLLFVQNVLAAATVCAVGASALAYAAHQQFVVKRSLFSDHELLNDNDFNNNIAGSSCCDKGNEQNQQRTYSWWVTFRGIP